MDGIFEIYKAAHIRAEMQRNLASFPPTPRPNCDAEMSVPSRSTRFIDLQSRRCRRL